MKRSRREIHRSIFYWLCLVFVFLLPVWGKLIPTVIALMVLNWIIDGGYIRNFRKMFRERQRILVLSFSLLYFLYMAGMLYSKNFGYGFFDLEVKLSLFVFPLLFASSDDIDFNEYEWDWLFLSFIAGCFTGVIVLLVHAAIGYLETRVPGAFYYRNLSWSFHPSYISMYFVFAIAVLGHFLVMENGKYSWLNKTIGLSLVLIFFLIIFLLSSKAGVIGLAMILVFMSAYILFKQRRFLAGLMIFLVVSASFFAALKNFPIVADRFAKAGEVVNNQNDSVLMSRDGTAERLFVWKAAIEVIQKHPLAGVGTGDVKDALYDCYREKGHSLAYDQKLNPHNQYLETFAAIGLPGILCLLAMLLVPFFWSIRKGYWLYFLFILVFSMNIFVESMFETQAGVVFYAFFNIVLFRARTPVAERNL